MIQVRCPQCAATLAIKQAPASGKLKCPKCAAIIDTASASATAGSPQQSRVPQPPGAPQGSRSPQASSPQPSRTAAMPSYSGEIDFRGIPTQATSAPSGAFPTLGQQRIYDGPISLDPIPVPTSENSDPKSHDSTNESRSPGKPKKTSKKKLVVGLTAAFIVQIVIAGAAFWNLKQTGTAQGATQPQVSTSANN